MRILIVNAVVWLLVGCNNKTESDRLFRDPFLDSFRAHGISVMIAHNPEDSLHIDSTFFDKSGNIVRIHQTGLAERRAFDSLHYLTRLLQISDIADNYVI